MGDDSIEFKETVSRLCSIEHFYMLMNNSGLTVSAVGRTYFDVTAVKTTNLACTSSSKVLAFTIPLPSLDEQNEIVSYLKEKCNYIDDVITKKEQFVNELENYKKSLIYEYVTGKKEVPEP